MSRFEHTIVQDATQLPDISNVRDVFMDVETVSGDPKRGGFKPYAGDAVCGYAFTVDDHDHAWYLPVRHLPSDALFHSNKTNLPIEVVRNFLTDLLGHGKRWINHNIKFDAHFTNVDQVEIEAELVDTLTLAKLVDMQAKVSGYGLKPLCKEWLGITDDEQQEVWLELKRMGTKDYGAVDAELLGKYACSDVILNRALWHEINRRKWDGIDEVWDMEVKLTQTLFEVERRGLRVNRDALAVAREEAQSVIAEIETAVNGRLDMKVTLSSPSSLARFITEDLGLPRIAVTQAGGTSVSGDVIREYREMPIVANDPTLAEFFELLTRYRDRSQFLALYAEGWLDHITPEGVMHPSYNQTVATGRMSCGSPNMQQLSKEAKQFIVPAEGNSFIRRDYSQVEYRVIAAICRDERTIKAYQDDPDIDFHQFVADMCGIKRKPAKSVNFGMAFGMGESKLTTQLAKELGSTEAHNLASDIMRSYHREFPKIRSTSQAAHRACKRRGYIKTLYGRRRALPAGKSHKAFNTAVQGTAADIMKERVTVLNQDEFLLNRGITVRAIVHDEVLLEGPTKEITDSKVGERIDKIMTSVERIELGVPLMTDGSHSALSWAEAE